VLPAEVPNYIYSHVLGNLVICVDPALKRIALDPKPEVYVKPEDLLPFKNFPFVERSVSPTVHRDLHSTIRVQRLR
jgi:hypothetical protein